MQNTERPAEEILQAEKKLPKKLWRRLLAAFMALVLIAAMFLGYAAQIRFGQLQYVGTVLEHAASVTADNTEYLSESTLKRAWNILRYAVGKPKTYDEFEMTNLLFRMHSYIRKHRPSLSPDSKDNHIPSSREVHGALPYMQGCIDQYPGGSPREEAVLHMRLGSLYALSDDVENAITSFGRAIETEPALADAYLLRAQMLSLAGRQEAVVADIRSYDALVGDNPAIRVAVGGLYESAGEYESAAACYTLGLEQSGGTDPELLAARGRCLVLTENLGAARQDFIDFFANGGQDPTGEYNLMLGLCRMEAEEYQQALNSFHNALNAGYAQQALVYSQCVLCAYIIGDYETVITDGEKALEALNQPSQQEPDTPAIVDGRMSKEELHHWIGLARMAGEDFEGAKAEFMMIEDLAKAPEGVLYYLGLCCASLGENEEAISHYTNSIEQQQMISLCMYNRGVSYLQLEKLEEGLTDLITVLQRNDDADATAAAAALLQELDVNLVYDTQ